jgi:hypothetical protein
MGTQNKIQSQDRSKTKAWFKRSLMATGIPALSILYGMVLFLGVTSVWRICTYTSPPTPADKLRIYCTLSFALAFPFWVWALLNTITGDFDLGIISMGLVLLTSGAGFCISCCGPGCQWMGSLLVPVACLVVAANYALALALVSSPTIFVVYLVSGLVVWLLAALTGLILHRQVAVTGSDGSGGYAKVGSDEEVA